MNPVNEYNGNCPTEILNQESYIHEWETLSFERPCIFPPDLHNKAIMTFNPVGVIYLQRRELYNGNFLKHIPFHN